MLQQIGCVELPNSDSVRNEAISATVMYVESDDIGDSGMVYICFGDDDDLTELCELELDTVLIPHVEYIKQLLKIIIIPVYNARPD